MDITRILAVAKKVRSGELSIPDLKMESNDEYEALWALVDTRAGVNCASRNQFPNAVPVSAPEFRSTHNSWWGEFAEQKCHEGRIFYDAPVDRPIISSAEESRLGKKGSNTRFRRLDAYIEDNATKER